MSDRKRYLVRTLLTVRDHRETAEGTGTRDVRTVRHEPAAAAVLVEVLP
jgi:hypothetical protein